MSLDGLKKSEIEMKPNQAYETVTRAQPATKIHTEPCSAYGVAAHVTQVHNEPDYEDVVQVYHWIWTYTDVFGMQILNIIM